LYERFSIQKIDFLKRQVLSRDNQQQHRDDIIWLCFPGFDGAEYLNSFVNRCKTQLIPKEGQAFVFRGPAAIAGTTPQQCINATVAVYDAVLQIVQLYPSAAFKIFCLSAGTHLGFYIANQLGKRLGRPVEKLVALSPGESIAYGIFSTWVTDELARHLEKQGFSRNNYDAQIGLYTQKANIDFLPSGENLVIHAGLRDTFIPVDMEGGTEDLVRRLRGAGKNPTYITHSCKDHVTLPLSIIIAASLGRDPYGLREVQSKKFKTT
jgi:hypothetical protein